MRIRRTRNLLAVTALAALTLTACKDGTGVNDEGASHGATSTAAPTQTTGTDKETGTSTGTGSSTTPGTDTGTKPAANSTPSAGSTGSGSSGGSAARTPCNGSNTKVTAQPVPRPLNHLLLTVTNTGSRNCDLTYYPVLRFDEMQWVPQAAKETQPQAVTTLAPGESGYAGVLLSAADGSGDGGTTGKKLTVAFQGYTPNSEGGASATPPLPAKGVYYDSSLTVTYWQQTTDDALSW
ncbi:DUF4232 domain-containing protein [Streptomyces sp. NBC_01275]|uniref:DUF4232 domain-containing protein n=1 Tax=Streptomyces sp. NBC_01275 TaxID=2903807 RepID=UPI002256C2F3|nr:DUF4232 domain-containing protein [Streptomyces sp. NBC_01275]MCX4764097.1 DUF4232 domain-containing protein [Streptomyces sp. NBC_01275]